MNPTQLYEIFKRNQGHCHFCGDSLEFNNRKSWHVDHVIQRAKGGRDSVTNYLPAHRECNHLRWNRTGREIRKVIRLGLIAGEQVRRNTKTGRRLLELLKKKRKQNARRRKKK